MRPAAACTPPFDAQRQRSREVFPVSQLRTQQHGYLCHAGLPRSCAGPALPNLLRTSTSTLDAPTARNISAVETAREQDCSCLRARRHSRRHCHAASPGPCPCPACLFVPPRFYVHGLSKPAIRSRNSDQLMFVSPVLLQP